MHFLEIKEVIQIHQTQIKTFGGVQGIRDLPLLESALNMPQAGIGEHYFHPDLSAQAGAYLYHIIKNHPFFDGNKRTGVVTALVFLRLNETICMCTNDEIYNVAIQTATSQITKEQVIDFFRKKIK